MSDLKNFETGDGFKSLEATLSLLGEPRKTKSSGPVQDAMLIGDDGGTLGMALWLNDTPILDDGMRVRVTNGWIEEGEYSPFKGKLIARLKKDGKIERADGAPAPTPQPPTPKPEPTPEPAPKPAPAPKQPPRTENGAREKRIVRQTALKVAAHLVEGTPEDVVAFARPLYRWAMGYGPHWIADEHTRKSFYAWLGEQGLDNDDAHAALGVYSVYDFEGTKAEAVKLIKEYAGKGR